MSSIDGGWLEAAIAWEVCASLHRQYCNGKDALFTTRQADFVKHAENARGRASHGQAPAGAAPACWIPPAREGEYHSSLTITAYREPMAGWEPLYRTHTAQATPAAVAGPSLYQVMAVAKAIHATTPDADDWDSLRQCEVDALRGRAEKVLAALTAAPTTQPAPQQEAQEPVAVVVPCHTPSGKRVALYSAKQDLPIGTKLYTAPQPVEREPLTDAQIKGLIEEGVFFGNCKEIVRAIEAAHGIGSTGGQHGAE